MKNKKQNKQPGEFNLDIKGPSFGPEGDEEFSIPQIDKMDPTTMVIVVWVLGIIFGGYFIGAWFSAIIVGLGVAIVFANYWLTRRPKTKQEESKVATEVVKAVATVAALAIVAITLGRLGL